MADKGRREFRASHPRHVIKASYEKLPSIHSLLCTKNVEAEPAMVDSYCEFLNAMKTLFTLHLYCIKNSNKQINRVCFKLELFPMSGYLK